MTDMSARPRRVLVGYDGSEAAQRALDADETARLSAWREWTVQLAATFDAADRSWMALRSVVDSLTLKAQP